MRSRITTCLAALTVAVLALPGRTTVRAAKGAPYPYVLIDLGIFGGPQDGVGSFPVLALNNSGEVAGTADMTTADL